MNLPHSLLNPGLVLAITFSDEFHGLTVHYVKKFFLVFFLLPVNFNGSPLALVL